MNIPLTPEFEHFIKAKIKAGIYGSVTEAIYAGLSLLQEQDKLQFNRLKHEIQRGLNEIAKGEIVDGEEVFRKLKAHNQKLVQQAKNNKKWAS